MTQPQAQQPQQQINIGTNLDGNDKYTLNLLMKIDYISGINTQLGQEIMRLRAELEKANKKIEELTTPTVAE